MTGLVQKYVAPLVLACPLRPPVETSPNFFLDSTILRRFDFAAE